MTIAERAHEVAVKILAKLDDGDYLPGLKPDEREAVVDDLAPLIAAVLEAAVATEREACALAAEAERDLRASKGYGGEAGAKSAANAIRARGSKVPS